MTRCITKTVQVDPDSLPDPREGGWEEMMDDVDELLKWLRADQMTRDVMLLRLAGCSYHEIMSRLGLTEHVVKRAVGQVRKALLGAGVISSGREEKLRRALNPHPGPSWRSRPERPARIWQRPPRARRPPVDRLPEFEPPPAENPVPNVPGPFHDMGLSSGAASPGYRAGTGASSGLYARSYPLTPAQSFGWRDVYYSEVGRTACRRR